MQPLRVSLRHTRTVGSCRMAQWLCAPHAPCLMQCLVQVLSHAPLWRPFSLTLPLARAITMSMTRARGRARARARAKGRVGAGQAVHTQHPESGAKPHPSPNCMCQQSHHLFLYVQHGMHAPTAHGHTLHREPVVSRAQGTRDQGQPGAGHTCR